ncbi:MAG: DUF2018 family protein [Epsilonproteobacteria bacterium]|nr:DUF2018 family protein [Campylobacterota bacterium]
MKYEALFEDEDNIFGGSPKSKYLDVVFTANRGVVEFELEQLVEKMAIMELILAEQIDAEDLSRVMEQFRFQNQELCDTKAKSLFIELTGDIVSKCE